MWSEKYQQVAGESWRRTAALLIAGAAPVLAVLLVVIHRSRQGEVREPPNR